MPAFGVGKKKGENPQKSKTLLSVKKKNTEMNSVSYELYWIRIESVQPIFTQLPATSFNLSQTVMLQSFSQIRGQIHLPRKRGKEINTINGKPFH